MKSLQLLLLVLLAGLANCQECNSTLAHYLSPHSLGKQDEFSDALKIICGQVRPNITSYQYSKTNYTLYNISVKCIYNDGKQIADIPRNNTITIAGGKVEFAVTANFSIAKLGSTTTGWAYSSVISEEIIFSKTIARDGAQTLWVLTDKLPNITLINPLTLKRIEPKQSTDDTEAISQALTSAITAITPSNVRQQLERLSNDNLTAVLNNTLKEEVFNNRLQYTFHHPYKGELGMNFTNYFHLFRIGPDEGFELMYLTFPENGSTKFCKWDLPVQHEDYSIFGGIQSAYGLDLVAEIARYALKKGWFDTTFNGSEWQTNAFQFYAGDLYNIINETQKLEARTRLTGGCQAVDDGSLDVSGKSDELLKIDVSYKCQILTNDTSRTLISNFIIPVSFFIKLVPGYEQLDLIVDSAVGAAAFQPVGSFVVLDQELANFKLSMALRSLQAYKVFGSGFPTWPRDAPDVMMHSSGKYFLLFDASQIPNGKQSTQ